MITLFAVLLALIVASRRTIHGIRVMPFILLGAFDHASKSTMVHTILYIVPAVFFSEIVSFWVNTWWSFVFVLPAGWWCGYLLQDPWTAHVLMKMDKFANEKERAYLRAHEQEIRDAL